MGYEITGKGDHISVNIDGEEINQEVGQPDNDFFEIIKPRIFKRDIRIDELNLEPNNDNFYDRLIYFTEMALIKKFELQGGGGCEDDWVFEKFASGIMEIGSIYKGHRTCSCEPLLRRMLQKYPEMVRMEDGKVKYMLEAQEKDGREQAQGRRQGSTSSPTFTTFPKFFVYF